MLVERHLFACRSCPVGVGSAVFRCMKLEQTIRLCLGAHWHLIVFMGKKIAEGIVSSYLQLIGRSSNVHRSLNQAPSDRDATGFIYRFLSVQQVFNDAPMNNNEKTTNY